MAVNPVGEDSWLAYLEENACDSSDLEKCVNAVELHQRAVASEPMSLRLWLAYCNYFWSLWESSQITQAAWPEEEQAMARKLFSFGDALDLWKQGYESIQYRLNDSHVFWNRWVSLEMELLAKTKTPEGIKRITHLFKDRLLTPHVTWEETSQMYSSFLSEYSRATWEDAMRDITASAQETKRLIAARDSFELKLKNAAHAGDEDQQKSLLREYLEWEMRQSKRNNDKPDIALDVCRGLYGRALTGLFATDEDVWYEYIVYLSSHSRVETPSHLLDDLRRAVRHCPWSGQLWSRYILCAEESKLAFGEVESIKHAATSEDQLYKNGMESMIEMYVAWCGFLKRTAMDVTATDEAVDVADVGLATALEDVAVVGKRLYGKDFQGDPKFRLERIFIQYLTEKKGAIEEARALWKKLASRPIYADNHDFWFRYYMWEMLIFSRPVSLRSSTPPSSGARFRVPSLATAVLDRAVSRKSLDWPEKVLEVYLQHCNDYETPSFVRRAIDKVHKAGKDITRRREREQKEKEEAYAAYYANQEPTKPAIEAQPSSETKRKRDTLPADAEDEPDSNAKRQKSDAGVSSPSREDAQGSQPQPQADVKRDRENTTILVENLPLDVTQSKIRQYFKDYGHINSLTALVREEKKGSSTALIEFSTPDESRSALLRDGKYFGESQLRVTPGYGLTIYVTNYPPTADETYIRGVFMDCGELLSIRWPSLRVNTHRRFCYISFRNREASARAVQKDGNVLEGRYKLVAKYSDPAQKKARQGALAEGRELYITNLDKSAPESELKDIFSKYGTVTRVNVPQTLGGKNRGFAYLDFETKEQAQSAAAELNNTKLRGQIVNVEVSKDSKVKPTAKSINVSRGSASPAPSSLDAEGDDTMRDDRDSSQNKPTAADISARTIALMGFPDTVNDARVKALVEPLGTVVKLVLQPGHGGAKIEFADAATAGKAALQLNSMEFEGYKLRTGPMEELRHAKASRKDDRAGHASDNKQSGGASSAKHLMPASLIRRPGAKKPGPKRGIGFAGARNPAGATGSSQEIAQNQSNGKPAPKSNADFKAMFLASSDEGKKEQEEAE
jgi:RNA recognition motif-containing protein